MNTLIISLGPFFNADFIGVMVLLLLLPAPKEMVRLLPFSLSASSASFLALSALSARIFALDPYGTRRLPDCSLFPDLCHHIALGPFLFVLVDVFQELPDGLLHFGPLRFLVAP